MQMGSQCARISRPIGAVPSTRHSNPFSSAVSIVVSASVGAARVPASGA
jgi:hypothetical protein